MPPAITAPSGTSGATGPWNASRPPMRVSGPITSSSARTSTSPCTSPLSRTDPPEARRFECVLPSNSTRPPLSDSAPATTVAGPTVTSPPANRALPLTIASSWTLPPAA